MAIIKEERKTVIITGYGLKVEPSVEGDESCGVCGGIQVYIRGRYPNHDNRLTCPTCTRERLEQILEIASPYSQEPTDEERPC